jgi:hypothetical protein
VQWLNTIGDAFAFLAVDLPAVLERLGRFFGEQVWPVFLEVLGQPLLWLGIDVSLVQPRRAAVRARGLEG